MFFRFACAVTLLTSVSLVGIALEKENLALKRLISLQYYDIQSLKEQRCQLVLETQRLAAPTRLMQEREQGTVSFEVSDQPSENQTYPLLNWRLQQGER